MERLNTSSVDHPRAAFFSRVRADSGRIASGSQRETK